MRMPFKRAAAGGTGPGTSVAGTAATAPMTGSAINHHMVGVNPSTITQSAQRLSSTSPKASSTSSYLAKLKFGAKQTAKLPDN